MVSQEGSIDELSILQLKHLVDKATFLIDFRTIYPNYNSSSESTITLDDILELTNSDRSSCTKITIFYANFATKYILNKSIFYFSSSFVSLRTLDLDECRDIESVVPIIFASHPEKFPSLTRISMSSSNKELSRQIYRHFTEYTSFIRLDSDHTIRVKMNIVGEEALVLADKKIYLTKSYSTVYHIDLAFLISGEILLFS